MTIRAIFAEVKKSRVVPYLKLMTDPFRANKRVLFLSRYLNEEQQKKMERLNTNVSKTVSNCFTSIELCQTIWSNDFGTDELLLLRVRTQT